MGIYSVENKINYFQGYKMAREDFIWCKGNPDRIKQCVESRKKLKQLSMKRKNYKNVSFHNGYLKYFQKRLSLEK